MNPSGTPEPGDPRHALRARMRGVRRAVTVRERLEAASSLASQLLPLLSGLDGPLAGYWAVGGELPLHAIQANLPATLRWCLPVLHDDGRLRFRYWSPGQALATNRHSIPEPAHGALLDAADLAAVLVPLLAFDRQGQRLGQGGGWYDRSFAFRRPDPAADARPAVSGPMLIGIGYDTQCVDAVPAAAWDVPLDAVATPTTLHRFRDGD